MAMPNLPAFDPYSDPPSLCTRWTKWQRRFEDAMIGFDITSAKRQRALLLHFGGEDLQDVFETLDNTGTVDEIKPALDALTAYFTPKKNTVYEAIIFRDAVQEENETIDQFCTRLRKLAKKCDFADSDREIQIQILAKCRSDYLRKRALEKERSLSNLLELARTIELAESRAKQISNATSSCETVSKLTATRPKQGHTQNTDSHNRQCYKCGFDYPHESKCPAEGKECRACGQRNHFARCCRNTAENTSQKETHTKENEEFTGNSQDRSTVKLVDQAEQGSQMEVNTEEYVFAVAEDSHQRVVPQKNTNHDENSYQRESNGKNACQRESNGKNSYQRETTGEKSNQRETNDMNSYQRESSGGENSHHRESKDMNSYQMQFDGKNSNQREMSDDQKSHSTCKGSINQNSHTRDVKESDTTGDVTNQDSHKRDVIKKDASGKNLNRAHKKQGAKQKNSHKRENVKQKNSPNKKKVKQKNSHKSDGKETVTGESVKATHIVKFPSTNGNYTSDQECILEGHPDIQPNVIKEIGKRREEMTESGDKAPDIGQEEAEPPDNLNDSV